MQLKQLLYLVTVAQTQSIRQASSKLFVSQQAISQSLQNLEEEYSVQLLNRSVHGITLTTQGEFAAAAAADILKRCDELEQYLIRSSDKQTGSLRIASIHTFKDFILPETHIKFIKAYPDIHLEITSMDTEHVISSVLSQQMDLGFLGTMYIQDAPFTSMPPQLRFFPLARYEYCAIIGAHSPLNRYRTLSIKSLLKYPIVFLTEQVQDNLDSYIPYRILSRFGTVNALFADSFKLYGELIASDMGIGIASTGIFEETPYPDTLFKPLRDNIYGQFGYIVHEAAVDTPIIDSFVQMLRKNLLKSKS